MDPGIGYVNANLSFEELEDQVPYLTGSFNGWRYKKMRPLHEWTRELDVDIEDPLDIGKSKGLIRRKVSSV